MRNKATILGALGSLLTVILMYHIVNLNFSSLYTHYLDSTEITDYALLESLLLPKGGGLDYNNSTTSMSDIHLTLDELNRLAAIHEPSVKPTTTIIIQYESIEALSQQLDSISKQKNINRPSMIHIVCSSIQDETIVQNFVSGKRKLHVSVTNDENNSENWYRHIDRINSDYVILINKGVVPGRGYFAFVLGLLHAPQFNRALIGTEPANNTKKICQQNQAHHVHAIKDIVVLKREWYFQREIYDLVSIALPVSLMDHELHGNLHNSCVNIPTGGLLFMQEEKDSSLDDMICQFGEKQQQGEVIHVVTVGEQVDNAASCPNQDIIIIHHPVINSEEAARTINKLSPQVVIYEKTEEETSAVDDMMKDEATSFIGLPTKEIPLVTPWIAELSIDTLQQWHVPKINLILTVGGKRYQQFRQLLHSVKQGHYLGDQVDIYIAMDEKSDEKSITMANDLKWTQGLKNLRHRISGVHPMQIFAEAWYPSHDDEYAVLLDDRIELSPSFYVWLKYALLKYRYYGEQQQTNDYLFGISLYSPRIIDTDPSGRQLLLGSKKDTTYLMQHPASQFGAGGALYFPEHWREFHDYITARLTDQAIIKRGSKLPHLFKDSLLAISKSNKWLSSWRKYFDEMIYMRGYVMLYPSKSYSTFVSIANTPIKNKKKAELYVNAEKLYKVPLANTVGRELLDLELMSVLDIHGQVVHDRAELVTRGHALQRKFSACEPILNHKHDPSDMLCPFNQLVQVLIDQKNTPTKTIALLYTPTVG